MLGELAHSRDDGGHGHAHRTVVAHEVVPDRDELGAGAGQVALELRLDVLEEPGLPPFA